MKRIIEKLKQFLEDATFRFRKFESVHWGEPIQCQNFYVLQTGRRHDSDYQCMRVVYWCATDKKYKQKTCCSDVIHFSVHPDLADELTRFAKSIPDYTLPLFNLDMNMFGNIHYFLYNGALAFEIGHALSSCEIKIVRRKTNE